jgi:hypothetical protein
LMASDCRYYRDKKQQPQDKEEDEDGEGGTGQSKPARLNAEELLKQAEEEAHVDEVNIYLLGI